MKKFAVALISAVMLVFVGAGMAQAQATDPVVTVDKEEVEPGGTVTVGVEGAEPDSTIAATIGDSTAEGAADADGNASIEVTVPDAPGQTDGVVNVNGVDVPISVLIAVAGDAAGGDAAAGDAAAGDGTPQPTAVNTGDGSTTSTNPTWLFAAAAALLVLGVGALTLRPRSQGS